MYENWGCKSFDLLLAFIDRSMSDNFYCSSLDFCLAILRSWDFSQVLLLIARCMAQIILKRQRWKSPFVDLFTMSYSQRHLMRIMKFMPPLWWNYYFSPHFATALVLISRLTILREFPHGMFCFYHDIVVLMTYWFLIILRKHKNLFNEAVCSLF